MAMRLLPAICAAALLIVSPGAAQYRRDQDEALAARRAGHVMPLRQIEERIIPRMPGCDYLGPEFDAETAIYRLKFLRGGAVIWVDVDGRTGAIRGRSGN